MSTTACDDQLAPEPTFDNHMGDVSVRFNVAPTMDEQLQAMTHRAEAAEAELAKLAQQKPVAYVKYKATGGNVGLSWLAVPTGEFYPREGEQLYVAPVPAPAVPEEWREFVECLAKQNCFPHPEFCTCSSCAAIKKARALLQSAGATK